LIKNVKRVAVAGGMRMSEIEERLNAIETALAVVSALD